MIGLLSLYTVASLVHFAHNAAFLNRYRWRFVGLMLLGLYAALGLDGLLHYARAPVGAHTATMNFTIWFEAAAATALLSVVVSTWSE